jgi:enoyl-CoA hydratase
VSGYETIRVETIGRVGHIILDRPKALNALNTALMHEVVAAATAFDADGAIGAIVMSGSDRAFAAGADITEMATKSYQDVVAVDLFAAWDAIPALRLPTIAAVSGHALGGGCELAMMCDLIIAATTAKFGQPEINLGVIPGMGGTQRLARAIGKSKAMDMVLTGRTIDAAMAEAFGLVARVVPAGELLETALGVAAEIAGKSRPVAVAAKLAVNAAFESTLAEGLRFERQVFRSGFALDDQSEGMAAFVEKRPAVFTNH